MSMSTQFLPVAEARPPIFVGVDVGGTSIKIGIVDDLGRTLGWTSIPTDAVRGAEEATWRTGKAMLALLTRVEIPREQIARVGLGSPGTMDIPAGMLLDPPNLPGWIDFPIRDRLSQACGLPVSFANDAAAAAYGEYWVGSGKSLPSLVMLTLGTGIGCGIIVRGLSIDGEHSHGAEGGHIIIDCCDDARVCSCGQPGHLEAYASALAVIRRTQEALERGRASSLAERTAAGEALTPLMLAKEAEAGDDLSLEIVLETARYLGIGVTSLMHTIDPSVVVLGGAMNFGGNEAQLGRQFIERVREEVRRRAFPVLVSKTPIEWASLGADAGYIGAAGIARAEHARLAK
ncbi:MAG TPA: ROK family protein [Pirellulales bacterium]|jgi:glucokinase|nr:ROK family protein [Pirellulales bacterium]